jgi:hypothetical protein
MKTIKIISGNLNNSFAQIPATSESATGKLRSLKKDGTFIIGRRPFPEEESLLWNFNITSKERVDKNNTRLYSTVHIPEEGVDVIDDKAKQMMALGDHLMNHQLICYFKETDEGRKQVNKNFKRNHLLYFELIDESAIQENAFNNARLETKYRGLIDEMYDNDTSGSGEFLELCYGMGISKPMQNAKRINYNLLVNKLQLNPKNFDLYWNDKDRTMVNTIQKGMKMENPETNRPFITQNEAGIYFFNGTSIGRSMTELKVHFSQHEKEFEWLQLVTKIEKKTIPPIPTEAEFKPERASVTPRPYTREQNPDIKPDTDINNRHKIGVANREVGQIMGLIKRAKPDEAKKRIENYTSNNPEMADYFNKRVTEEAIEKGIELPV